MICRSNEKLFNIEKVKRLGMKKCLGFILENLTKLSVISDTDIISINLENE